MSDNSVSRSNDEMLLITQMFSQNLKSCFHLLFLFGQTCQIFIFLVTDNAELNGFRRKNSKRIIMDNYPNRTENVDQGTSDPNDQQSQDKLSQSQHPSKRAESSHRSQSRPNSRGASTGQHSRTRSNTENSSSWNSVNPFINFMHDFRKMHSGQKNTNILSLGGEEWRNMTTDQKQPFIDAANENKRLKQPQPTRKQQRQNQNQQQSSKTSAKKDNAPRKVPTPKKRKGKEQRHKPQLKKKRTKSVSETHTDTDTSGSIHTATTDCASDDSDQSS